MKNYDEELRRVLDKLFEDLGLADQRQTRAVTDAVIEFGQLEYDKGLDEGRRLASQFCPQCGSCGVTECCPATKCAYFSLYDKTLGDQLRDALETAAVWKERFDTLLGLDIQEEVILRRWRDQHIKCIETPNIDTRCQLCKATDKRLAKINTIGG